MNHLGLFEGIGGFSLAVRWIGWKTIAWCEKDEFCTPQKSDGYKTTSNSHQKNLNMLAPVGSNSQLNPQFVAEMMGFPPDWTLSPFLSGEANPSNPMETQ